MNDQIIFENKNYQLSKQLLEMLQKQQFTDCTIFCDDGKVNEHKISTRYLQKLVYTVSLN